SVLTEDEKTHMWQPGLVEVVLRFAQRVLSTKKKTSFDWIEACIRPCTQRCKRSVRGKETNCDRSENWSGGNLRPAYLVRRGSGPRSGTPESRLGSDIARRFGHSD